MTIEELSMMAYQNRKPDLRDLSVPEWLLWYRLRDVYRENTDNPENGAAEKNAMLRQFDLDRADWVSAKDVSSTLAAFWKRIEQAGCDYAKHPGVETGDRFFEAVYCVPRKKQEELWQKGGDVA